MRALGYSLYLSWITHSASHAGEHLSWSERWGAMFLRQQQYATSRKLLTASSNSKSLGRSVPFDVDLLLLLEHLHTALWDWDRIGSTERLCTVSRNGFFGVTWGEKMAKIDWKPWWSKGSTFAPEKGKWKIPTCLVGPLGISVGCAAVKTICNSPASSVPPALPKHVWKTTALECLRCHLEGSSAICPLDRHQVWQGERYLHCALVSVDLKELVSVRFSKTS